MYTPLVCVICDDWFINKEIHLLHISILFIFCSSCLESSAMFDVRHRSSALTVVSEHGYRFRMVYSPSESPLLLIWCLFPPNILKTWRFCRKVEENEAVRGCFVLQVVADLRFDPKIALSEFFLVLNLSEFFKTLCLLFPWFWWTSVKSH